MKTHFYISLIICLLILFSCEKNKKYKNYIDYLDNKKIKNIILHQDYIWVYSSMFDKDAHWSLTSSMMPMTYQFTKIKGEYFSYKEDINHMISFKIAPDGNLYTIRMNKITEIRDINNYHVLFSSDTIYMNDFAIHNNEIWFACSIGLGHFRNNKLNIIKEVEGTDLTTTHMYMTLDNNGVIWVSLHSKGQVLRIENNIVELIDNIDMGIDISNIELGKLLTDKNNNLYIITYIDNKYGKILKYDGIKWEFETIFIGDSGYIDLHKDVQNRLWMREYIYNSISEDNNRLFYLIDSNWIEFDVSDINTYINCIEANNDVVYIGTNEGIEVIPFD